MIGFAKKIGMTRLFIDGKSVAVTSLVFEKSFVVQTKNLELDGYNAVQVGAYNKSAAKSNLASKGHSKKHGKSKKGSAEDRFDDDNKGEMKKDENKGDQPSEMDNSDKSEKGDREHRKGKSKRGEKNGKKHHKKEKDDGN